MAEPQAFFQDLLTALKGAKKLLGDNPTLADVGFGTTIFANKPGDGSAREQAASCQKVLGGWANLACDYATKRYRSNLINWGMLPLLIAPEEGARLGLDDLVVLPNIRTSIAEGAEKVEAVVLHATDRSVTTHTLRLQPMTDDERAIILAGCLINFYGQNAC